MCTDGYSESHMHLEWLKKKINRDTQNADAPAKAQATNVCGFKWPGLC
jgi:hypothetical protein